MLIQLSALAIFIGFGQTVWQYFKNCFGIESSNNAEKLSAGQWIQRLNVVPDFSTSLVNLKDISIAHVIIIIKSEVSTFPIVFIFFRGCVPEMFVTSYSVTYCIYIPANREFAFISIV